MSGMPVSETSEDPNIAPLSVLESKAAEVLASLSTTRPPADLSSPQNGVPRKLSVRSTRMTIACGILQTIAIKFDARYTPL